MCWSISPISRWICRSTDFSILLYINYHSPIVCVFVHNPQQMNSLFSFGSRRYNSKIFENANPQWWEVLATAKCITLCIVLKNEMITKMICTMKCQIETSCLVIWCWNLRFLNKKLPIELNVCLFGLYQYLPCIIEHMIWTWTLAVNLLQRPKWKLVFWDNL